MKSEGNEASWTIEVLAWLEVNKMRLAVVAVVLGLTAAVMATYQWRVREGERSAQAALQRLQLQSKPGQAPAAVPASAYVQIAEQHEGTRAAAAARLLAAAEFYREGKYAEAQAEFVTAGAALRDAGLQATAAFGVAACLDALGRTNEAFTAYQDVTQRHATAAVATQARLQMGELLEARGEASQAMEIYDELSLKAESAWSTQAREMREFLLSRHPELAPTNPVPTEPVVVPTLEGEAAAGS